MKDVTIYTDGSCLGNPGPGGFAAVLACDGHTREVVGGEPATTNNRMELRAVVEALSAIKKPCAITLYCDSQYAIGALTGAKAKANRDLVAGGILALKRVEHLGCTVKFEHVEGHAGNALNELCDNLARAAAEGIKGAD